MRVYVASSWRNPDQPGVVQRIRAAGHEVYDFREPAPGNNGFAWSSIDPGWKAWTPEQFIGHVNNHPLAADGFKLDKDALDWCDAVVLVLPCGRSAHLEAGYAAGKGKWVTVLLSETGFEPELMYLLCDAFTNSVEGAIESLRDASACALSPVGDAAR